MEIIEFPPNINRAELVNKFGQDCVNYYERRLEERTLFGKKYTYPFKTIYLWATQDKKTHRGYFETYRGFNNYHKTKRKGKS